MGKWLDLCAVSTQLTMPGWALTTIPRVAVEAFIRSIAVRSRPGPLAPRSRLSHPLSTLDISEVEADQRLHRWPAWHSRRVGRGLQKGKDSGRNINKWDWERAA